MSNSTKRQRGRKVETETDGMRASLWPTGRSWGQWSPCSSWPFPHGPSAFRMSGSRGRSRFLLPDSRTPACLACRSRRLCIPMQCSPVETYIKSVWFKNDFMIHFLKFYIYCFNSVYTQNSSTSICSHTHAVRFYEKRMCVWEGGV